MHKPMHDYGSSQPSGKSGSPGQHHGSVAGSTPGSLIHGDGASKHTHGSSQPSVHSHNSPQRSMKSGSPGQHNHSAAGSSSGSPSESVCPPKRITPRPDGWGAYGDGYGKHKRILSEPHWPASISTDYPEAMAPPSKSADGINGNSEASPDEFQLQNIAAELEPTRC